MTIIISISIIVAVLTALFIVKTKRYTTHDEWFAEYKDLENDAYLVIPRMVLKQASKEWQHKFFKHVDKLENEVGYWKGYCVDYNVTRIHKKTKKFKRDVLRNFREETYKFKKRRN